MYKLKILSNDVNRIGLLLFFIGIFFIPGVFGVSPNDACFNGACHTSPNPKPINHSLYDSNPHGIIKCIDCHVNSINSGDPDHGKFIRQLNGSNITGPLTTSYNSQNFYLCYFCHTESKIVGQLSSYISSTDHINDPIVVTNIGTNFINTDPAGYHDGSKNGGPDIPTNIHWNHLDDYGSINAGIKGMFDYNKSGNRSSYESCPACHDVHGTNYPKMTKNDLAITYGSDSNGTFGYIGSDAYLYRGGDIYCTGCHTSGTTFKYYRTEINVFDDCISCHVVVENDVNISKFGKHADINKSDGTGVVSNSDCWTCHYKKDMDRRNVYLCDSCHKNNTGVVPVNNASLIFSKLEHGSNTCKSCHAPDTYHVQGTVGPRGRIENPGWQRINPVNYTGCHDCHTTHNGLDEPFHGPGIAVESGRYHVLENNYTANPAKCDISCHNTPTNNRTTHNVARKSQNQKPVVVNMSLIPSMAIITNPVDIIANGSKISKFLPIEAAQYQVRDSLDRIIINWTSMNAKDGRFNSSYETVNATINTSGLAEGTYKVSVRVMASAPNTILGKPYYPLNGDFSAPMDATLVIQQPKGFLNGTVINSFSLLPIEGAIVATNTIAKAKTDASGFYSLRLPEGTYLLNVTKDPEYDYNDTLPPAPIIADTTLIQDVVLIPKPVYALSGKVTNASSGLGINGALVKLDAYPQYNTTTVSGDYSMNVPAGTYQVSAGASGYSTNVTTLLVDADIIQDFILTPSTGMFIPWIAYSQSDWLTPLYVQNAGTVSANFVVAFYDQNGNLVTTQSAAILPNATSVFWPPVGPTAGGSAVITSTQNVVAIVNEMPKNGLDGMSYSGFTQGSTKVYIPWIAYSQTDWYTPIQIQNIDSVSADVSVAMYDQTGNPVATQTATIQPRTSSVFWPPVGPTAGGSAVITSTRNVIAIVNEMGKVTPQAMSYEGFIAGSRQVYIPAINFSQTNTYTPIQVQNIGTASASVNVNFYDSNGVPVQTQTGIIPPNTASVFWPPAASTSYGSAVIESTQDVIAIVNEMINNNNWAMSYDGFAAGSSQVSIPWIAYGNSGWNTPVYVQNTGTVSANVAVSFYDQNGAPVEIRNAVIPANTSQIFVPASTAPTTGGSAVVVSSQPVAAVVNQINTASTVAMGYGGG